LIALFPKESEKTQEKPKSFGFFSARGEEWETGNCFISAGCQLSTSLDGM
jgi:hypothetical protein